MRVFTPAQAKLVNEERTAKDALRARGLAEITEELRTEKNTIEQEFQETMARQRLEAGKWFEETTTRKNELKREVERLEERRKQALMPPLIKAEDIHSVSEALHARKLQLDLQESENEDVSRALMRKLDDCSNREQDLDRREKRVKIMEQGAETQRTQVAAEIKHLNLQLADYQQKVDAKQTEFAYRESELDARKNLLDEREQGFVKREEEIQASMRLLDDQRLLLAKGFEELRRLKNK